MIKGTLTKDQAIALVGADAVAAVERQNCEPTCRVGYNGACQGDSLTEWSSAVSATDSDGEQVTLLAYYYTSNEQDQAMADADGDGSAINWEIEGYEIA